MCLVDRRVLIGAESVSQWAISSDSVGDPSPHSEYKQVRVVRHEARVAPNYSIVTVQKTPAYYLQIHCKDLYFTTDNVTESLHES